MIIYLSHLSIIKFNLFSRMKIGTNLLYYLDTNMNIEMSENLSYV